MQEVPKSPPGLRADAFNFHKSIGLCLLALMLFRLGWRSVHPPPPLPALPVWQAQLAKATHIAMYAALIVMPLTGYLGSVWSGHPIKWFGATLPAWGTRMPALKEAMSVVHLATSSLLLSLVALHIAGTAHHAFRGKDIVMRMTFATRTSSRSRKRRADRRLHLPSRRMHFVAQLTAYDAEPTGSSGARASAHLHCVDHIAARWDQQRRTQRVKVYL